MFVNELNMPITAQKQSLAVKLGHNPLELHTINQKHRNRRFSLTKMLEKNLLHGLCSGGRIGRF
ncbi:hypothetical protein AA100600_3053 [Gluconobacter thailandicus F149-1 = NBRC 100600]|nr:hypothetical protein AA100600_3053 [Gluconobacter thailandicus F149-1 = NBRC 100600]